MWKKLNFIFNRRQKIEIILLWIIIVIGAFAELLGVSVIMPFTQVVLDSSVIHTNRYYSSIYNLLGLESDKQFMIFMVIAIAAIYIVKNAFLIFMNDLQNRFSYINRGRLANKMMKGYLSRDYLFHSMKNISELYRNVTTDSEMLYALVTAILQFLTEAFVCLTLFIYLLVIDFSVTISLAVLLGVFAGIFLLMTKKSIRKMGETKRIVDAQMDKWVRQSFEGIKEVKILNREGFFLENVTKHYSLLMTSLRKIVNYNYIPKPIFEGGCVATIMLVIGIKINNGVNLTSFVPTLTAFVVAAFRLLPSFSRLTTHVNTILYNRKSLEAVYADLKEIEGAVDDTLFEQKNINKMPLNKEINIDGVSFHYPNVNENVLENVSFKIPVNNSVAFIGPSGAGKTTLADIVLGILKPQKGQVLCDDVDIQSDIRSWQSNLGYIPQNIYLMDDTIRNNILFGVREDKINEKALEEAINKAQLKDFIDSLEEGLNTFVGEHGVRLSGGQRQRIGIARALYNNPDILILDEATSALDNETEKDVMEAITSLHGKITMIIVAHRLSTIKNCDHIFEVKDKSVVERDKESIG